MHLVSGPASSWHDLLAVAYIHAGWRLSCPVIYILSYEIPEKQDIMSFGWVQVTLSCS